MECTARARKVSLPFAAAHGASRPKRITSSYSRGESDRAFSNVC